MERRDVLRGAGATAAAGLAGCSMPGGPSAGADFYVSPRGDDEWSGTRADPSLLGDDGPFRTVARARDAVRERASGGSDPVTVLLRGGTYRLEEPLTFGPKDSGTADAPVTYAAYPGEAPVVSGGREIDGWEATTVNGVDAWTTTIPAVRDGDWYFRQLFVDGRRRRRPILPERTARAFRDGEAHSKEEWGLYAGLSDAGEPGPEKRRVVTGEIDPDWRNLDDVEVVTVNKWIDEHAAVEDYDSATNVATLSTRTFFADVRNPSPDYYLVNVFEALSEPGEWYLDRTSGECYYVPEAGEEPGDVTVTAPVADRLLETAGTGEGAYLTDVAFEGLVFRHNRWHLQPPNAADSQGEHLPAAVSLRDARRCGFDGCTFGSLGTYALELERACRRCRVAGCTFEDLGAGAVQVGQQTHRDFEGDVASTPEWTRSRGHRFTDNTIRQFGRVFHRGVGFLAENVADSEFAHNRVHDGYHSGFTVGGQLGYSDGVDRDNAIARNHLHHLGKGLLSDFGGVYVRGRNPGTVVSGNRVHHLDRYRYGGWGLYPDLGCSDVTWERNVVFETAGEPVHQHFGRRNAFRNNVLVGSGEGVAKLSDAEPDHLDLTFERNVLVARGEPVYEISTDALESDRNLFWDADGEVVVAVATVNSEGPGNVFETRRLSLEEWQAETGHDAHSVAAEPGFADPAADDYALADDSPAFEVGFEPIDRSAVGPRPSDER